MKRKIKLILCLSLVLLTSCIGNDKEEQEKQRKIKISIEKRRQEDEKKQEQQRLATEKRLKKEEEERKEKEMEEARKNPLKKYISDEIFVEGREIFYERKQYMFTLDRSEFSGKFETLEKEIKAKFRVSMLATHKGVTSAIVNYSNEGRSIRAIVNNRKTVTIGEDAFYLKTFKDRVEIKKGENPLVISLYSRER